jgi:hypothetical protein
MQQGALVLRGSTERALLHGGYELLERLGAVFPLIGTARLPRIGTDSLDAIEDFSVEPAFARRAFASDIMTWHYEDPKRLRFHFEHDRRFIPWMAARGINAFSYIGHPSDSRLKIGELLAAYQERGIASEYGGHVLQLLLPRDRFNREPDFFPANEKGVRSRNGNLCVSSAGAVAAVCENALRCARQNPEGTLWHIWGADVRQGAWCRCAECAGLSPQQQHLKVVNAIAATFASEGTEQCALAYLAYHDTLEPDLRGLRPLPNVHFEWAPRQRCYSHTIDDPGCAINPRYYESLRRYVELFEGRGHIFEYYADAILFGGLGIATPAVIAGDLRAYRALGLDSISCLTFGAYSALAYPVNLEAFVRGTRSPDFEPDKVIADTAAQLHPQCAAEMAQAYRAIAQASASILDYGGDVMRPKPERGVARLRQAERVALFDQLDRAAAAAEHIVASSDDALGAGERLVWRYNRKAIAGIIAFLAALEASGTDRLTRGEAGLAQVADAVTAIHEIQSELKGTWGTYDIEWIRPIWLEAMRRRLTDSQV